MVKRYISIGIVILMSLLADLKAKGYMEADIAQ